MRYFLIAPALLCMIAALNAQSIERVYPDDDFSMLLGVVTTDNGDLYVAGANNTLLRSTDGGVSWEQMPMGEHRMHIHKLVTDGQDLYMLACAYEFEGHPELWPDGYSSILFRFKTRQQILENIPFPMLQRVDFTVEYDFRLYDLAATGTSLYLSYAGSWSKMLRSTDRGAHWEDIDFPKALGTLDASYFYTGAASSDLLVYFVTEAGGTFYLTTDDGNSWENISAVYIDERPIVYLGAGRIFTKRYGGECLLYDGSGEWHDRGKPPFVKTTAMTVNTEGAIFACSGRGGIFRTTDEGASWDTLRADASVSATKHYRYACAPIGTDGLIAVNQFGNILLTTDNGISWSEPRAQHTLVARVVMADAEHGRVMFSKDDGSLPGYKITDDGFRTLKDIPPSPLFTLVLRSPTLWYSMSLLDLYGDSLVCRSTDAGQTWELVLQAAGELSWNTTVESADPDGYAVVTTKGLYFTSDRGDNWSLVIDADWSSQSFPATVFLPADGKYIWMLATGNINAIPLSIMRLDIATGRSDMVFSIPVDLPPTSVTGGFEDIVVNEDGHVYATCYLDIPDRERDDLLVVHSDDNGVTWQTWTTQTPVPDGWRIGYPHWPRCIGLWDGALLTAAFDEELSTLHAFRPLVQFASTDEFLTEQALFEHALPTRFFESCSIVKADARTAYFSTPSAIYRITMPEVTHTASLQEPPLPLSIATPFPHPVSRSGEPATLFIQSDRTTAATMSVYDLAGRELSRLFGGELGPQGLHVSWRTQSLTPGSYILQLTSQEGVCRRKVIVE
jgi:photosystem II stability/assembly factor-like uncharacterized protein